MLGVLGYLLYIRLRVDAIYDVLGYITIDYGLPKLQRELF